VLTAKAVCYDSGSLHLIQYVAVNAMFLLAIYKESADSIFLRHSNRCVI